MVLSTAERNRRKRERKKQEREERRKEVEDEKKAKEQKPDEHVEIEYVSEAIQPAEAMESIMRRFQQRAAVVTDDEKVVSVKDANEIVNQDAGDDDDDKKPLSKRKLRELTRPSVAELKRRVKHPDLVEAHDVTAPDPDFLIELKAIPGTVTVPRHWGRKRKYLQGKRGFEKQPFQLPDFIVKTGITAMRDTLAEDQSKMSQKQKSRARVAPKMGAVDIDYRTLYDSFFKHQTKPGNLTAFGDLYYEGKELETRSNFKPGGPLSQTLREALGMMMESSPPPWLISMQRYGPPPSYPNLKIPGLNAPLPNDKCQYGYHVGGWGKPPVDTIGRPLYGGNPFDAPGGGVENAAHGALVTSDGKTVAKTAWGALPSADIAGVDEEESEEEEEFSEEEEMEESEGSEEEAEMGGAESVLPPRTEAPSAVDLRKQAGVETPLVHAGPKQLYTILEERRPEQQSGVVFSSDMAYVVPVAATVPEGAESVLSKVVAPDDGSKKKRRQDGEDDEVALDKNFKF